MPSKQHPTFQNHWDSELFLSHLTQIMSPDLSNLPRSIHGLEDVFWEEQRIVIQTSSLGLRQQQNISWFRFVVSASLNNNSTQQEDPFLATDWHHSLYGLINFLGQFGIFSASSGISSCPAPVSDQPSKDVVAGELRSFGFPWLTSSRVHSANPVGTPARYGLKQIFLWVGKVILPLFIGLHAP